MQPPADLQKKKINQNKFPTTHSVSISVCSACRKHRVNVQSPNAYHLDVYTVTVTSSYTVQMARLITQEIAYVLFLFLPYCTNLPEIGQPFSRDYLQNEQRKKY